MINISQENKELCFADSTLKPLKLFMYSWVEDKEFLNGGYWALFTIIEDAIILESAENSEGILEGNTFKLGSYVLPQMKVKWQYDGTKYKNSICIPVQQIGTEHIAYFTGYVTEEKVENDGVTVTAKITPNIEEALKQDIVGLLQDLSGAELHTIISEVLDIGTGLVVDENSLIRDFANSQTRIPSFTAEDLPKKLTVDNFLKNCAEFLGAHIKFPIKKIVTEEELKNAQLLGAYQPIEFVRIPSVSLANKPINRNLPERYKQIEYIQSNGTQYIDTGVIPNENTGFDVIFSTANDIGGDNYNYGSIFGARQTSSVNELQLTTYAAANSNFAGTLRFGTASYEAGIKPNAIMRCTLLNKSYTNNEGLSYALNDTAFSTPVPITVFALNDNGTIKQNGNLKLYGLKLYDGEMIVRDFVPCIDNLIGTPGMYDLVGNEFYMSGGLYDFVYPKDAEIYTLPYYISLNHDKTAKINFHGISLEVSNGSDKIIYTENFKTPQNQAPNIYEISNNLFFDKLDESTRITALRDVGGYVTSLDYYNCDLRYTYAPFIEPNDLIVCNNIRLIGSGYLSSEYTNLQYIDISETKLLDIYPNAENVEIDVAFELLTEHGSAYIFDAYGYFEMASMLRLFYVDNKLLFYMGDYGGVSYPTFSEAVFEIPSVPTNQRINLKISCANGQYKYSGTYYGEGVGGTAIQTDAPLALGGRETSSGYIDTPYRLYHFSYSQNGEMIVDLYPAIRNTDNAVGLYDLINKEFIEINSETAVVENVVLPVLNSNSKGIHSMKADVVVNSAINK